MINPIDPLRLDGIEEFSEVLNRLETGRYGLHVLGFGILRRSTAYIHIGVTRHFPRPVGRIRQYDE